MNHWSKHSILRVNTSRRQPECNGILRNMGLAAAEIKPIILNFGARIFCIQKGSFHTCVCPLFLLLWAFFVRMQCTSGVYYIRSLICNTFKNRQTHTVCYFKFFMWLIIFTQSFYITRFSPFSEMFFRQLVFHFHFANETHWTMISNYHNGGNNLPTSETTHFSMS